MSIRPVDTAKFSILLQTVIRIKIATKTLRDLADEKG